MSHSPRFLDKWNVDYIKSQIETGNAIRTKRALQQLCKLYRIGFRISPPQVVGVEQSIVGLLYTQAKDEKVRRWALNALARLGREATCIEVIVQVLSTYGAEPQTTAAGIAAVYKLSRKASEILKRLSFDETMVTLAALQHVNASQLDLSALPLNVETASADLLKLAVLVVGLNRAPTNMLNPRYSNAEMVKVLGGHDDSIVSQYTVWAITENKTLGIADLGIDIRDVEQQPTNVRSWIYQLLAMNGKDAKYLEYIGLGIQDPEGEVRSGLALGLRDTYFDGLEPLVLDWYTTEGDPEVSHYLLDHLVKQARHCRHYEVMALEVYEREPAGSSLRQRMEAAAAGSGLFGKFRQIDFNGSNDLFRGVPIVNNTFNINGGVQGGAVSFGGSAENSGATAIHYNPQTVEAIQSELSKAERELHAMEVEPALKQEALEHIHAAKADPSPDKVERVISILGKAESLASKAMSAGRAIAPIIEALSKMKDLF